MVEHKFSAKLLSADICIPQTAQRSLIRLEFEGSVIIYRGTDSQMLDMVYFALMPYLEESNVPHLNGRSWSCRNARDKIEHIQDIANCGPTVSLVMGWVEHPLGDTYKVYDIMPFWMHKVFKAEGI